LKRLPKKLQKDYHYRKNKDRICFLPFFSCSHIMLEAEELLMGFVPVHCFFAYFDLS
jgi:hypothetical protein